MDDIRPIRERAANGTPHEVLATEYGVSRSAITAVVMRKNWRHVR